MEDGAETADRTERPWSEVVQLMADGKRIDVRNATITGVSPLEAGVTRGQIRLTNCVLQGKFDVRRVTFAESILFADVIFEDGMNLEGCTVVGDFVATGVVCKIEGGFERLVVRGRTSFDNCRFDVRPDFSLATFGGYTSFARSIFREGAGFAMATVEGTLILDIQSAADIDMWHVTINGLMHVPPSARFDSLLNLRSISASSLVLVQMDGFGSRAQLSLEGARLASDLVIQNGNLSQAADECLNLKQMTASGDISIFKISCDQGSQADPKRYHDKPLLTLTGSRIRGSLNITNSSFNRSNGQGVSLSDIRVNGSVRLSQVVCTGTVSLVGASILGRLWLEGENTWTSTTGNVFHGEVNISGSVGELWCVGATFKGGLSISDLTVSGNADVMFCGVSPRADFNRAEFRGRFGCIARFHGPATFENTIFRRAARFLSGTEFNAGADFYFAQFEQEASFGGTKIRKVLDLRYARFSALLFEQKRFDRGEQPGKISYIDEPTKVELDLRGCTYELLMLPDDFDDISDFADRISAEDSPSLVYLERFLRRAGRAKLADEIRRKRYSRERKHLAWKLWKREWWWNLFYRWSSEYGTVVLRMFLAVLIFGIASGMAPHWTGYSPLAKHVPPWCADFIKLVTGGIAAVASALGIDALRRRFSSD
jgi:hypothetical protein